MNRSQTQPEITEEASAISVAQLCDLTGYSPAFISSLKGVLPAPFTVPSPSPRGGKPAQMYPLEKLAALILERTNFLSDVECRLRVALSATASKSRKGGSKMSKFLDEHFMFEEGDVTHLIPRGIGLLPPELREKVTARLAADRAELRARRHTRHQPRPHATPEGTQP